MTAGPVPPWHPARVLHCWRVPAVTHRDRRREERRGDPRLPERSALRGVCVAWRRVCGSVERAAVLRVRGCEEERGWWKAEDLCGSFQPRLLTVEPVAPDQRGRCFIPRGSSLP